MNKNNVLYDMCFYFGCSFSVVDVMLLFGEKPLFVQNVLR